MQRFVAPGQGQGGQNAGLRLRGRHPRPAEMVVAPGVLALLALAALLTRAVVGARAGRTQRVLRTLLPAAIAPLLKRLPRAETAGRDDASRLPRETGQPAAFGVPCPRSRDRGGAVSPRVRERRPRIVLGHDWAGGPSLRADMLSTDCQEHISVQAKSQDDGDR